MFQLQHSLGSAGGLPSLGTAARSRLFLSFFPFFVPCLVSGQSSSSLSVFCFVLGLQITRVSRGASFTPGWSCSEVQARCLLPSPSVAAGEGQPGSRAMGHCFISSPFRSKEMPSPLADGSGKPQGQTKRCKRLPNTSGGGSGEGLSLARVLPSSVSWEEPGFVPQPS